LKTDDLLKESNQKIINFHRFHLRKTSFRNKFKHKISSIKVIIDRIKQESNV
jgi:hypothetical protein